MTGVPKFYSDPNYDANYVTPIMKEKIMPITKPAGAVKCEECRKTAEQLRGANNWKICDTCQTAYCHDCFKKVHHMATNCTAHKPWGKFLIGSGTFGTMTFK